VSRLTAFLFNEEQQYAPFVAAAIFVGLIVGFPLGFLLAHAAAEGSSLGGYWAALAQAHGQLQLMGWVGLFVMGMGFRLVPRFTGVRVRPAFLAPLTLLAMVSGLLVRAVAQPFADEGPFAALFAISAALEAAGALIFATAVLRCLASGRREQFLYSPFFGAGAVWLAVAAMLNFVFVIDAASDSQPVLPALRSISLTYMQLYGFVAMFIFAISLRTFPIFFHRRPAPAQATIAAWALANGGIAAYAAAGIWLSYDSSADVRVLQSLGFLAAGVSLLAMVALLGIFWGEPQRLRTSARRSMRFVRSAYAWLFVSAGLQTFFASRSLIDQRFPAYYEIDAVRHFLALGFITTMIIGMSLLVMPRLAMRRAYGAAPRFLIPALLALLHGAAAARGAGSLLVNETRIEEGFWTMTAGGLAGILAVGLFAAYLIRQPSPAEIPLTPQASSSG